MPPEALAAPLPAPTREHERETVHFRPDLSAWAVLGHEGRPSVADHNPASVHWRDLTIDPDLTGIAPTRARHAAVVVTGASGGGPWRLPLRTLLCAGLAWHPRLPLLAGLVQQGNLLHPWTADYVNCRLTVHEQVRAALSLSSRRPGQAALTWCGERELALLTTGAADSDPVTASHSEVATDSTGGTEHRPGGGDEWSPVVYEATGPGHVAFLPGIAELLRVGGASVSVLTPATGEVRTLGAPLLVGSLTASPSGQRLLVEHATAVGMQQRAQGSVDDGFNWSRAVLSSGDGSWTGVPPNARWAADRGDCGDTIASSGPVAGGTGVRLRSFVDDDGARESPAAELTIAHEGDDPPLWWRCVSVEGEPAVVSRHRAELRFGTPGGGFPVPLPSGLGRLGACGAERDGEGVLVGCVQDGRAALLRFDRARKTAGLVVEPLPDENDGPLEASWASVEDGTPAVVTQRGGRFVRHVLRGDRLRREDATMPALMRPAPSSGSGGVVPHALVLPAVDEGESARLTLVTGHHDDTDSTDDTDATGAANPAEASAQLLWIHVRRSSARPVHPDAFPQLSGLRSPAALLDLPLRWPDDAEVACVQRQILHAVDNAVDALRERHGREGPVVVGGHSFAATVALHALAHSTAPLAGAIAHSGCYNRTLTPEGFQYERRSYWQAPELYRAFSAVDFADRLDRPVLLVHGCDDTNTSTPPDQAVALYRAVVATGGRARLVLLPREGHSFRHRESLETVTREHDAWLAACSVRPDRTRQANTAERT